MNHWFDGLAMLHRFSIADGEVSYANRFLESRAYRAAARRRARSPTRSSPPTPAARSSSGSRAMFSPKLTDNANVNLTKLGERFIAMTETPIPVEFDARDARGGGRRLRGARAADDRPPAPRPRHRGACSTTRPSSGRATATASSCSRPDAREARGDRDDAGARARLHALVRAHRALARPGRVPVRRQPAAAGVQRPALHRELPLEARAAGPGSTSSTARPARAAGPFETEPASASTTSTPTRRTARSSSTSAPSRTPAIVEDLYLDRLRAGKPVAEPQLERFRISPEAGTVEHERLVDEPIELPRINYGRCNERPYRYVWGVGVGERLDRPDRQGRRRRAHARRPGRRRAASRASRCSSPAPDAEGEDEGVLLSVVLDGAQGQLVPARPRRRARSTSWPAPRSRTTSRSASTGSSRPRLSPV